MVSLLCQSPFCFATDPLVSLFSDKSQPCSSRLPPLTGIFCCEQGSWSYVAPRFDTTMRHTKDKRKITYIGRPPSAAPATGNAKKHSEEVVALMNDSFTY